MKNVYLILGILKIIFLLGTLLYNTGIVPIEIPGHANLSDFVLYIYIYFVLFKYFSNVGFVFKRCRIPPA